MGDVLDLKKALSEVTGLSTEKMAICDVYSHKIFDVLGDKKPIKSIRESDLIYW